MAAPRFNLRARHFLTIFLVCLLAFSFAFWRMLLRIEHFNLTSALAHYHAEPVVARSFRLEGFPPGELHDHLDAQGRSFLRLVYAGKESLIPVKPPPTVGLDIDHSRGDLSIYDEWVKLLAFNQVQRVPIPDQPSQFRLAAVPDSQNLWIITRTTPPGYDPDTWGSVRRVEWVFTFYILKRDGSIDVRQRRMPRSYRSEQALQQLAASPDPDSDRYRQLAAIPPLAERSAEYFAALHVIPKLNVPSFKFQDTAFSFAVLSWTAPVAGFAALLGLLSLAFTFAHAAQRRTAFTPPSHPPARLNGK